MRQPSRRDFLTLTGGATLGLSALPLLSCHPQRTGQTPPSTRQPFRVIEVEGTHRELGRAHGEACRELISRLWREDPSFAAARDAARGPQSSLAGSMRSSTQTRFPHLLEELEGIAEGANVDFEDLFAWTCRAELSVATNPCPPGCSTVGLVTDDAMHLHHNEDGSESYLDEMVVFRARPPSGVAFTALVYPGTIAGNGPGLNNRGLCQTTNYIAPCETAEGVPKYFIGRALLEAENLDSAVALATFEGRAFAWHHNLAHLPSGRLISLEVSADRHSLHEVRGCHLHTNHFVHDEMRDIPQRTEYVERSSAPRYSALERRVATAPFETRDDLISALSDRSSTPCRVCRQAGDEVPGVTVAVARFASPNVEMQLQVGPPCEDGATATFTETLPI